MVRMFVSAFPCIHSDTGYDDPALNCGINSFRKIHGFLCPGHYKKQQAEIPPAKRKPLVFRKPMNDDQVIADIIKTDRLKIEAGPVRRVRFGSLDPEYVRLMPGPMERLVA